MDKLLQSEIILHEKERGKIIDLSSFGIIPFKLSEINSSDMSFVLSELYYIDPLYNKIQKLFHRESAYRKHFNLNHTIP